MPNYVGEIIACAAILLAASLVNWLPSDVRRSLFIVIFSTGMLAAVAANAAVIASFTSLFG